MGVLAAAVLLLGLISPSIAQAQDFSCTEVIGYSQSMQWYFAGFQEQMGRGRTQLRWQGGGAIDNWADPGYAGWSGSGRVNGCSSNAERPDRIILDVSDGFHDEVGWWVGQINTVLGLIRARYPNARQIVLQPVVGGPGGGSCQIGGQPVRAASNHPVIWQAINQVAGGDVVAGAKPTVRSCGDYADSTGHLTDQAKGPIGTNIGQFYVSGQIAPPPPAPPPVAPPPPAPPEQPAPPPPAPAPPAEGFGAFCPADLGPEFAFGFATLSATLGEVMGAPMSCEHGDPAGSGDVLQETTTGLAFYRVSTNTPTFTDGWNHWGLTPEGMVYWTGSSIDPPQ
jgi:hypothetical protein